MLKIIKYPDPVLRRQAARIEEITPEIFALLCKMKLSMEKNRGIGLAGPQVGISRQIIVVKGEKTNHVFLNPKIEFQSKRKETDEEGCLSLPGIFFPVKRSARVRVMCHTPEGKPVAIQAEGLAARIFQHEIDHLQGKLIIDRIPFWQRFKMRKQLREMRKNRKTQSL